MPNTFGAKSEHGGGSMQNQEEYRAPVIGILCIDIASNISTIYGSDMHSYIAASYVSFLESAGSRVIPIWIGQDREYYEEIMSKINGILLPGGSVFINDNESVRESSGGSTRSLDPLLTNECVQSAKYIYDIATDKNNKGEYFPLWGTCLGFQLLLIHDANGNNIREPCTPVTRAMHINLTDDFRESYLFTDVPAHLLKALRTEPFAIHNHRYCITPATIKGLATNVDWHILATNRDSKGLEFVTIVENRKYPYFGIQFHPERVAFEHIQTARGISTNLRQCIELTQFLSHKFVDSCRRSSQQFDSLNEEYRHLIYNFKPTFTGRHKELSWLVCYLFTRDIDYPSSSQ